MTTATQPTSIPTPVPAANRIVVGVDGSESSLQALRWARHLARPTGASIQIITAWPTPIGWSDEGWADDYSPKAAAEETVQKAVDDILQNETGNITLQVAPGSPAQLLIEAGKGAAMIIVGSRGHGGFAGLLMGSVSSTVAEHATCPVLVVHCNAAPGIGAARAL